MKIKWYSILLTAIIFLTSCSSEKGTLDPVDINDPTEITYTIQSGSNITLVSKELESLGYISSAEAMISYAQKNEMTNIKAGTYTISKNMSADKMVEDFYAGNVYKGEKFVVQEGLEAVQIAEKIEAQGLGDASRFMELVNNPKMFSDKFPFLQDEKIISLEGYLYPLTYHFKETDGEEYIIEQMLKSFNSIYLSDIEPLLDQTDMTLREVIILASIVEREAALEEEMPIVASVFMNRLKINMPLQSCATVQYIIKERKWILSSEEIAIDSPYNTYKYNGLPVAAIASPSLSAIKAVLQHPETEYLYFLSKNDGTGSQVFSVTYEEHLMNKKKYLG